MLHIWCPKALLECGPCRSTRQLFWDRGACHPYGFQSPQYSCLLACYEETWYHISLVCKSRPALFYDKCGSLFRLATYCTQTKTTLFMLKSLFSQALGSHCRSVYIYRVATLCNTVHNDCVQNNVGIWLYLVNYATKLKFFSS